MGHESETDAALRLDTEGPFSEWQPLGTENPCIRGVVHVLVHP